ncbi:MAG: SRPBCC domain-containing protein [bacterium]
MKLSINVTPMSLEPIAHEYDLRCSPAHAFDVYVNRIGEWWHPDYTANPQSLEAVTIEPRVGGRVYATHRDEGEDTWGRVTVWEPPRRLVYTSTLAQGQDDPSEITVRFTPSGDGCKVRFEHGGWNEATRPTGASSRIGRSSSTVSPRSRTRPQPRLVLQ